MVREESFIDFVQINVSGTITGQGFCCLTFLLRWKYRFSAAKNRTKTVRKYHNYTRLCSTFIAVGENKLGVCFGLGPFALDTAIETTIRGSFWKMTFLGTKSINEFSLRH